MMLGEHMIFPPPQRGNELSQHYLLKKFFLFLCPPLLDRIMMLPSLSCNITHVSLFLDKLSICQFLHNNLITAFVILINFSIGHSRSLVHLKVYLDLLTHSTLLDKLWNSFCQLLITITGILYFIQNTSLYII